MFTLTIAKTDNAAFEGDPEAEVARLLEVAAQKLRAGYPSDVLIDFNGNKVGSFELTDTTPTCPECGATLTADIEADGRPCYCPQCDREVG